MKNSAHHFSGRSFAAKRWSPSEEVDGQWAGLNPRPSHPKAMNSPDWPPPIKNLKKYPTSIPNTGRSDNDRLNNNWLIPVRCNGQWPRQVRKECTHPDHYRSNDEDGTQFNDRPIFFGYVQPNGESLAFRQRSNMPDNDADTHKQRHPHRKRWQNEKFGTKRSVSTQAGYKRHEIEKQITKNVRMGRQDTLISADRKSDEKGSNVSHIARLTNANRKCVIQTICAGKTQQKIKF